jgi:hypothetical protein
MVNVTSKQRVLQADQPIYYLPRYLSEASRLLCSLVEVASESREPLDRSICRRNMEGLLEDAALVDPRLRPMGVIRWGSSLQDPHPGRTILETSRFSNGVGGATGVRSTWQ